MAALDRRLEGVLAGAGGCVLVGGESGVGKTSLVAEVARAAALKQLMVVAGECQPLGGAALHPLRPLLRAIFDRSVEGGIRAAERWFGPRVRVLAAVEPDLARLPGFDSWPAPPDLPADAARARLLGDLRDTVAAFAEERPLLLVLDDLQWADALSLQFLLSTRPEFFERNPVLVLATYRSEEQPELLRELIALAAVERVELGRLDPAAVGSMVSDMLALQDPPAGFVDFLAAQSEGNPFFVAEYLRTAVAERLLERRAGRWVVGGGVIDDRAYTRLPLPGSLRELVGRRLVGLPSGSRALAEQASVLGREIDARLLLEAAQTDEREAMDAVRELLSRQVLEQMDPGRYRFVHDKLREIAYEGIAMERRPELHRIAASSLEAVFTGDDERARFYPALARHYEAAGESASAVDYLEKAADEAARVFADPDVAVYLEAALRLDEAESGAVKSGAVKGGAVDARRRRRRGDLGMALRRLGRQDEARTHLEQAVRDMGQPVATGSIAATVGRAVRELVMRRSLRHAPVEPRESDPIALATTAAYNYLAMIAYHRNDVLSQVFYTFAALGLAPRTGPSPEAAHLYGSTANIVGYFGLQGLARRYGRLSHAIADAAQHPLSRGIVRQYTGHLAALLGDLASFEADMQSALEIYTAVGHVRFREEALTNLGYLYSFRGELEGSLDTFRAIEQSGRARDDVQTTSWGLVGQGRALAMLGQLEEALRLFDQAEPLVQDDLGRLDCPAMRSLVRARLGRAEEAEADARRALDIVKRSTATSYTTLWSYSGALEAVFLLWDASGAHSAAARHRQTAAELCAAFQRFGRMIPLARPRVELWRAAYAWRVGRRGEARRRWRRSIEGARRIGLPIDEAKAHYWTGRSIDGDERTLHLGRAIELFERTRCAPEAAEARQLLAVGDRDRG
jgi:tetratricopeptide (TPR) repeat protein